MKKILCILLMMLPLVSFAKSLADYPAVISAIRQGKQITLYMDFAQCGPNFPVKASFSPRAIMQAGNHIAFSDNHFTRNNPQYLNQSIMEYVHYKLYNRGVLHIAVTVLDAATFANKGKGAETDCEMNRGVFFYSS